MGIDPIRYRPWSGERRSQLERIFVISKTFFRHNLRSKWLLALMILGIFLVISVSLFVYVLLPHTALEPEAMAELLGNGLFLIITMLLAAIICSDTISEDLRSNSFVLYFSRAIRAEGYLAGKMGGAALTLSLFGFFPQVVMALVIMATQSGGDYGSSLAVFGRTLLAAAVTTMYFLPFGLLISSLTTRKAYASVATFMVVFAMSIVGGIFATFDRTWVLVNPMMVLSHFYDVVFGVDLVEDVSAGLLAAVFAAFFLVPLGLVWVRIRYRAVGK